MDVETEQREQKEVRKKRRKARELREENKIYHDLMKIWTKEQMIKPFTDVMPPESANYIRARMGLAPIPPEESPPEPEIKADNSKSK